jgi:hypothetical protein
MFTLSIFDEPHERIVTAGQAGQPIPQFPAPQLVVVWSTMIRQPTGSRSKISE